MKRFYCLLTIILLAGVAISQPKKTPKLPKFNKSKENNVFLKKQWWLGFKAGTNVADVSVIKSYTAISPINYSATNSKKEYQPYAKPGAQATLEATFYFSGLSLTFQPTYRSNIVTYTNEYEWSDAENASNSLQLLYEQDQRIDYMDFPLMAKYEFMKTKVSPYVQAGLFTSLLVNATKSVTVSGVDYASGGEHKFKNESIIVGAKDLFATSHWGMLFGAGVYYNLGNVRLNVDVLWKAGLSNITSTENRFGSDRLSGVGDTLDDMKLNNLTITVGSLFPLRFLSKTYKSSENKK